MDQLKNEVKILIGNELERANKKYPLFRSQEEAFGVMYEEGILECTDEFELLKNSIMEFADKMHKGEDLEDTLVSIRTSAMLLACESIQAAAMAEKSIISLRRKEKVE